MPHFTIEASGGANPVTEQLVLKTLEQSTGGNQQLIRAGTEQLSNWESRAGYYSALQDVYANLQYHQSIRHQAIIQLKNGIDNRWRKTSMHVIGKQEKMKIRTKAIQAGIQEPIPQLGLQNALMLAKIVRYEFPHDWPDVITDLTHQLRQTHVTPQHLINALNLVLYIIKELATARLQRSRTSLKQSAPELFQVLGTLYIGQSRIWIASLQSGENIAAFPTDSISISYCALKAIRRLCIAGFEHPHRDISVSQFWTILQGQLGEIWPIAQASHSKEQQTPFYELVSKHLVQLSKLHLDMARTHPASFTLLPGCVSLLQSYWSLVKDLGRQYADELSVQDQKAWKVRESGEKVDESSLLEKVALKGLLLFRACLKMAFNPVQTFKYQHSEDKEERKRSVDHIKTEFLADSFVLEVLEVLVTQFFVLRPSDLRDWEEEPSEWEKREGELTEVWEFSLRSCSERLFLDLIINYKAVLVPQLVQVFYRYTSPGQEEVFLKDSLYTAIGLAAAVLINAFDFNAFLKSTLLPESQLAHPSYHLIRRRMAIVLGQWTPVIPETIEKPTVYRIMAQLLAPTPLNDQVVRVTAGRQLRAVLEPFEFSYDEFAPYATSIFQNVMALIKETELVETKMALLETIRLAVERMETHVEPFTDDIMRLLPGLWESSAEEHLMRQAILSMITAITHSLKGKSVKYHHQILPLIYDSVQPGSESQVYLLEDALDLWSAIIQQTPSSDPTPSTEILSLTSCLPPLLGLGTESLRQTLNIIESYVLLSPSSMLLSSFLGSLLSSLSSLVGGKDTGIRSAQREISRIMELIETFIKTLSVSRHFPDKGSQLQAAQHLMAGTVETSFLEKLLSLLKEAYDYHQDPRPSRPVPAIVGPTETEIFSVLARLVFINPNLFIDALGAASGPTTAPWLVSEWIAHFDNIGDVYRKKLQALAITSLFTLDSPPPTFMLEQLQSLMTIWTDLITELGEDAPEETKGDYLWQFRGKSDPVLDQPSSEWAILNEAPEEERRREVSQADPVYETNIRDFVATMMHTVVTGVGGQDAFQRDWASKIDRAVLDAFINLGLG
jgi:hypothetical protein